jgi:hypothetical protein
MGGSDQGEWRAELITARSRINHRKKWHTDASKTRSFNFMAGQGRA